MYENMNILQGQPFNNGTARFLMPAMMNVLGEAFKHKLEVMTINSFGIGDMYYKDPLNSSERNFFICFEVSEGNKMQYGDFIFYVKQQFWQYYVYNYNYKGDVNSPFKMLVLKFPEGNEMYENAYDKFKEGKYSEMYPDMFVDTFLKTASNGNIYEIIKKTDDAKRFFKNQVYEEYGTKIKDSDITECLLPPKAKDEIFNFDPTTSDREFLRNEK